MLEGLVTGGQGLGLDALGGVDEQDGPFAGGQRPAHLVAEVDVAGSVDEVQDVVFESDPDVLGLDGDAPLTLEIHGVEVLLAHEPGVDGVGQLENAVRQGRLAVVDVADNGEIADEVRAEHGTRSVPAQPSASGARRSPDPVLLGSRPWWCPVAPPVRTGFSARPGALSSTLDRQWAAHGGARLGAANNHMANIKSQIKRNRQNERRRLSNKSVRSEIRTRTKTAVNAIDAGSRQRRRGDTGRGTAHRQGRGAGCHPQESSRQPQVPTHASGQRRKRGLSLNALRRRRRLQAGASTIPSPHRAG